MRHRTVALLIACAGCGPGERAAPGEARAAVDASDTATLVPFPAAGVPDWSLARERGIGVVHFDPVPGLSGRAVDTLVVRDDQGLLLARLIADSTLAYRFEARPGVLDAPAALEFGYEEIGLPLLASAADGRWRVHLGTRAGAPVGGWVAPTPGRTARTLWEEALPTLPLFFVVPADSVRFHEAPDGPLASFALPAPADGDPGNPGDYILWPLERSGDWMRVRAVTPSDFCADPLAPREDTLWIRWRAGDGRPRVWYFTRGC